jgi:hypothetical protein
MSPAGATGWICGDEQGRFYFPEQGMDRLNMELISESGTVRGSVRGWLRAEGLCILLLSAWMYHRLGLDWWVLALFFMAPDLSMLAYLGGRRIGAVIYNASHSYVGPLLLAAMSYAGEADLTQHALIWLAHIGFCRAGRFGLKYADSFDHTHLGRPPVNLPVFLRGLLSRR